MNKEKSTVMPCQRISEGEGVRGLSLILQMESPEPGRRRSENE